MLSKYQPKVIETEAENEAAIARAEELERKRLRTLEENTLLKLLTTLIKKFEQEQYLLTQANPYSILLHLMEAQNTYQLLLTTPDSYLATHLGALQNKITVNSEKIAFLEGQLSAYSSSRAPTKSKTAKKEQEFWFIKPRAKELGLEISANQYAKIEMWANESYKQRHGELPKRQPFRGTQAFAYPLADLDILDATIKGVVAQGHG